MTALESPEYLPSSEPREAVEDDNAENKYERYGQDDTDSRLNSRENRAHGSLHYPTFRGRCSLFEAHDKRTYQTHSGPVNRFRALTRHFG